MSNLATSNLGIGFLIAAISYVAGRRTTPAGISPIVTMRQSAIKSFLAKATMNLVLRPAAGPSVLARNHSTNALSFWNNRNRQVS